MAQVLAKRIFDTFPSQWVEDLDVAISPNAGRRRGAVVEWMAQNLGPQLKHVVWDPEDTPASYWFADRIGFSSLTGVVQEVATLPKVKEPTQVVGRIVATQEWEGYINELLGQSFTATLRDKKTGASELGEFDLDEVSDDDQLLLRPGAVFNWVIGYETTAYGVRKKVSFLYFRRLPTFSRSDLAEAEELADELHELFPGGEDQASNAPSSG